MKCVKMVSGVSSWCSSCTCKDRPTEVVRCGCRNIILHQVAVHLSKLCKTSCYSSYWQNYLLCLPPCRAISCTCQLHHEVFHSGSRSFPAFSFMGSSAPASDKTLLGVMCRRHLHSSSCSCQTACCTSDPAGAQELCMFGATLPMSDHDLAAEYCKSVFCLHRFSPHVQQTYTGKSATY